MHGVQRHGRRVWMANQKLLHGRQRVHFSHADVPRRDPPISAPNRGGDAADLQVRDFADDLHVFPANLERLCTASTRTNRRVRRHLQAGLRLEEPLQLWTSKRS